MDKRTALEIARELDRRALLHESRGDCALTEDELTPVVETILSTCADLPRAAADDDGARNELAAVLIAIRDCKNDTKCSVCASIIRHALIRAKARASTPRAQTGLTVEAALAELRELLPDSDI